MNDLSRPGAGRARADVVRGAPDEAGRGSGVLCDHGRRGFGPQNAGGGRQDVSGGGVGGDDRHGGGAGHPDPSAGIDDVAVAIPPDLDRLIGIPRRRHGRMGEHEGFRLAAGLERGDFYPPAGRAGRRPGNSHIS